MSFKCALTLKYFLNFAARLFMNTDINYISILIQFALAAGFVVTTILVTHWIGPKRKTKSKLENTEGGIPIVGNARLPFNIKYFVAAILFVLFDVEVIFMYPWAVNFKELGSTGFIEMVIFVATLLIGFFYIIKKGALKWDK